MRRVKHKMQVVIKISEEMYKWVNDVNKFSDDYGTSDFIDLVKKATPLPKGHGRLVDADEIDNNIYDLTRSMDLNYGQISEVVDTAPTIIEADEVES